MLAAIRKRATCAASSSPCRSASRRSWSALPRLGLDVYGGVDPIGLSKFWDGSFWGWPSQAVFRNIYCGLMLGVVFGFLDNFGLFYGTSALDGTFYSLGNKIASGLLADSPEGRFIARSENFDKTKYTTEVALAAHQITEDMMSGLGNTFSCAPRPFARTPAL